MTTIINAFSIEFFLFLIVVFIGVNAIVSFARIQRQSENNLKRVKVMRKITPSPFERIDK